MKKTILRACSLSLYFLTAFSVVGLGCGDDTGADTPEAGAVDSGVADARILPADSAPIVIDGPPLPDEVNYLIIAGDNLAASAARYKTFREGTGYTVALALMSNLTVAEQDNEAKAAALKNYIRKAYDQRDTSKPFYVLLLGDGNDPIPTETYWDSYDKKPTTTDNFYADMDDDTFPDLAIGRIPARTDEEADLIRKKIESYENSYNVGTWNRRLNMFASTGDFGNTYDTMIEKSALMILDSLSYDYDVTFTYGNKSSEFVYIPEQISDKVYEEINEGSLVTAYVGHGSKFGLDDLSWGKKNYPMLDVKELTNFNIKNKMPIFVIIACSTGSFDDYDAISEQMLRLENAPPAIIASTEISHPWANAVLVRELAVVATEHLEPTAGMMMVHAKKQMGVADYENDKLRTFIDLAGMAIEGEEGMAGLIRTHNHMYILFGDPAMKIRYVEEKVTIVPEPENVYRGNAISATIDIEGFTTGKALFSLESSRTNIVGEIQEVPADSDPTRDTIIQQNYDAANEKIVISEEVTVADGKAKASLLVPSDLPAGYYYLKVYADNGEKDAFGSLRISVLE